MKGNELLDKMELVDPTFIEDADRIPVVKKKAHVKWGVIAACICLLMGTVTVMAVSGYGTKVIEFFTSRTKPDTDYTESGFTLSVEIEKVPVNALKGKIREVPAYIKEQFASYKPYMNWYPGNWQKIFESRNDAYDYIGFGGIKRLDWDLEEGQTTLNVNGEQNGDILAVTVGTQYKVGDIGLQFFSTIYTENTEDDITTGIVTTEYEEYSESFYTTKNKKVLHVIEGTALESGYMIMDGYFVQDGVLYNLHLAHLEKDTEQAKELLHQWADLF